MKENNLLQKRNKVHQEVLDANENYAANFGEKKDLGLPPARKFAILHGCAS
jgi:carbonic anhydrase